MLSKPRLDENIQIRSEEVQEIISRPPAWLIRWGITLIFLILTLLICLSFLIRYPDFIVAKVMVTTKLPTERIAARASGQIDSLFVLNGEKVGVDQPLAVIKNPANLDEVFLLKSTLSQAEFGQENDYFFPLDSLSNLRLGELAIPFLEFEKSYLEYRLLSNLRPFDGQIAGNKVTLIEIEKRIQSQRAQKRLLDRRLSLAKIDYERNKLLHEDAVISDKDFESKEIEYLQTEEQANQMAISISQIEEAFSTANQNIKNTYIKKEEEEARALINLIQSYESLKLKLIDWEYKYLIKASISGVVSYQKIWGTNQSVSSGDMVFTVLPENTSELLGVMKLAAQNAGKVSIGQKVLIKLDNYPFQEFGALIGEITTISVSPDEELNYLVYASLPQGVTTSFQREIPFKQELLGSAEIITEDLSVAERLFFRFSSLMAY